MLTLELSSGGTIILLFACIESVQDNPIIKSSCKIRTRSGAEHSVKMPFQAMSQMLTRHFETGAFAGAALVG